MTTIQKWLMSKKSKRILIGVSLVLFLLVLLVPTTTHALETNNFGNTPKFVGDCESDLVDLVCGLTLVSHWAILGILYVIGNLFAMVLSGMASVAIWVIGELGIKITTHSAVSLGFGVSLTIANVVFVIAIIVIAFATILRWHEYEAKKMLPKLIITALLVNFSLLAAGLMLDASNVFTTYFLSGDRVTATKIGSAFNPQMFNLKGTYGVVDGNLMVKKYNALTPGWKTWTRKRLGYEGMAETDFDKFIRDPANTDLLLTKTNAAGLDSSLQGVEIDVSQVWAQFLQILPKVIFAVLATFIGMLTVIAICIMALIRNIWVVVLLIVMPLAWALRVLPKFEQYWQKWWEKFLNWGILYLPTIAFFLYLAVETATKTRNSLTGPGTGEGIKGLGRALGGATQNWLDDATGSGIGTPTLLESLVLMLIVIGIMIAGLKVAQAMGSGVAGAMANFAGKSGRKLAGGLVKTSIGIPTVMAGASAGALLGWGRGLYKAATAKGVTTTNPTTGVTTTTPPNRKGAFWKGWGGSVVGGGQIGALEGPAANLYGRAAQKAATGLTYLSALPIIGGVLGSAANVLSKTSAAQRGAVDNALAEAAGKSPQETRAWIRAAAGKGDAYKAAAMELAHEKDMLDAIPAIFLGSYADAVKRYTPGAERKKIDVLKASAAHNPLHAHDISGETTQEVAERLDTAAIQALEESVYDGIKQHLTTAQRKAYAGKDGKAQNKVLAETITSLSGVVARLPASMATAARDLNAVIRRAATGQKADPFLMRQVSGHLEKIAKSKALTGKMSADELLSLRDGRDISRNTNLRTKSKAEHGAKADANWGIGSLLERFARVAAEVGGRSGGGGGSKAAAPKH